MRDTGLDGERTDIEVELWDARRRTRQRRQFSHTRDTGRMRLDALDK
jgi:hypothetical protein